MTIQYKYLLFEKSCDIIGLKKNYGGVMDI